MYKCGEFLHTLNKLIGMPNFIRMRNFDAKKDDQAYSKKLVTQFND